MNASFQIGLKYLSKKLIVKLNKLIDQGVEHPKLYRLVDLIKKEIDKNIVFECNLIFDLTECDYISSSGLRVLMIISKKIEKARNQKSRGVPATCFK